MNRARDIAHVRELLRQPLIRYRYGRIGRVVESWPPNQTRRGKRLLMHWWQSALERELLSYADGVN